MTKKTILLTFFIALGLLCGQHNYSQNARIKIDTDRIIGEVNPNIYGNFVEHLGRCVYGGIYDPGSPLSDDMGFRKDVMEAARALNVSIVRYPGGNFVSNYHWLDGVGPQEERVSRMELAWNVLETNQFGTNEFVEWSRRMGAEPFFTVNMGTGTIEEARRWLEYTNIKEGPYYAELRRKHGYSEPHNVKYWALGNEMDGSWQMGALNAEDYAKKARETAKLLRWTDPSIKIIAAGSSSYGGDSDPDHWNSTVLREMRNYADYIALHTYVGNRANDYYNFVATPHVMEHRTKIVRGMVDREMYNARRGSRDPIYIAWTEWNVWYRTMGGAGGSGARALEEHYNLEDALVVAGFLNGFIRNADIIKMANMAQLVNVIAPIFTNEKDLFRQTIYFPLELFANNALGTSLDIFVECDEYTLTGSTASEAGRNSFPYLDVSATYNDGEVVIAVINRHQEEHINTDIISQTGNFAGSFTVHEITGPDIKAVNDFGNEVVKTVEKPQVRARGDRFTYSFPPLSVTMLKGRINQ
ncbi:MAG: alpha-N-arabinofuranosidase [Bacteroidales bacterium]